MELRRRRSPRVFMRAYALSKLVTMKWIRLVAILQGADVVLTLLAVEGGRLGRELNPVVRGLLEQGGWGILAFVVLKVATVLVLAYMRDLSDHRLVVLSWRFAMYYTLSLSSIAVVWNVVASL